VSKYGGQGGDGNVGIQQTRTGRLIHYSVGQMVDQRTKEVGPVEADACTNFLFPTLLFHFLFFSFFFFFFFFFCFLFVSFLLLYLLLIQRACL
jgi:hypothetical protein